MQVCYNTQPVYKNFEWLITKGHNSGMSQCELVILQENILSAWISMEHKRYNLVTDIN